MQQSREAWWDLETGTPPVWFPGPQQSAEYWPQETGQLRIEAAGTNQETIEGLDAKGDVLWRATAANVTPVSLGSGELAIFSMERESTSTSTENYDTLARLDPRTGDELWQVQASPEFNAVTGAFGTMIAVHDPQQMLENDLYSAIDGTRTGQIDYNVQRGRTMGYVLDEGLLSAVDSQAKELWSTPAAGDGGFVTADGYLITHDLVTGRLTRWG